MNTKLSRTLLNTAIREIGLRSVSIDRGWEIFPNGSTSDHFHNEGTVQKPNNCLADWACTSTAQFITAPAEAATLVANAAQFSVQPSQ